MQVDRIQPRVIAQIGKTWTKAIRTKLCMHPEAPANCTRSFGKAHSVQRSKLKRIARTGKVLRIGSNPMTGTPGIKTIGIKQASTFYGFCNFHDNKLFAPIENTTLALNNESALLLAFRAMSVHMYYKRRRNETDLFQALPNHQIPPELIQGDKGIREGLHRLLHFAEPTYDRMGRAILHRRFSGTRYCAIMFKGTPDVLCSDASIINFGFDGNLVREKPQPYDFMTLSLLPYRQNFGIAAFAWHGNSKTNENFVKSLLSLRGCELPDAIVRFTFRCLNNFFFAPKWWTRLKSEDQDCLLHKATDRNMIVDLTSDGSQYVDWNVTDIKTNLRL